MPRKTVMERLQERFEKSADGCWLWTGPVDRDGYGRISYLAQWSLAHRVMYAESRGLADPALELDHLCRVRHCVNPDHLEPVTRRENALRSESFAAKNARKTHCARGHEFTPENTRVEVRRAGRRPTRVCRTCDRIRASEYAARKRLSEGRAA